MLWKTLKSLGLSKKISVVQTNTIEDNKRLKYDLKSTAQTFAKFYSNLAESLLKNLPNSPNKFDINSVHHYYKKMKRGNISASWNYVKYNRAVTLMSDSN